MKLCTSNSLNCSKEKSNLLFLNTITIILTASFTIMPSAAQAQNTALWGKTWIENNRYYVMNNAYDCPRRTYMSHYANNVNDWGGSWDFGRSSGGIGVAQINYGKWPWGEWTASSGLPIQINSTPDVYSSWSFSKGTIKAGWNAYYEMWIHSSSNISDTNITGDLMIHPDWDGTYVGPGGTAYGVYEGEVTLSGTQWYVRRQGDGVSSYAIIHYFRKTPTQSTGVLRLDDFWEHYASRGWGVNGNHWIGSITAAFEAFNGYGNYRTTSFSVSTR